MIVDHWRSRRDDNKTKMCVRFSLADPRCRTKAILYGTETCIFSCS